MESAQATHQRPLWPCAPAGGRKELLAPELPRQPHHALLQALKRVHGPQHCHRPLAGLQPVDDFQPEFFGLAVPQEQQPLRVVVGEQLP